MPVPWRRPERWVVLLLLLAAGTGCRMAVKKLASPRASPVGPEKTFQLAHLGVTVEVHPGGFGGGTHRTLTGAPASEALGEKVRALLLVELDSGPSRRLFCDADEGLPVEIDLRLRARRHPAAFVAWTVLCAMTLGLGPLHRNTGIEATCFVSVRRQDGSLVREYKIAERFYMSTWYLPPGMATVAGKRLVAERWDDRALRSLHRNLLARMVSAFHEDREALAAAHAEESREPAGGALAREAPLPRVPEPTRAIAPPATGLASSLDSSPRLVWQPELWNRVWVLAIGISRYRHTEMQPLACARNDAEGIAAWFREREVTGALDAEVDLLVDEEATSRSVREAFDRLRSRAEPEDLLLVYVSCRGALDARAPGGTGDARYILLHDSDPASPFATALAIDELARMLDELKSAVQVVVLDVPWGEHGAGAAALAGAEARADQLRAMGARPGRAVLAAAAPRRIALRTSGGPGASTSCGLFTRSFLQALGSEDRRVLRGAFIEARRLTELAAQALDASQEPVAYGDLSVDAVLARR